jgi:hypothetical protein
VKHRALPLILLLAAPLARGGEFKDVFDSPKGTYRIVAQQDGPAPDWIQTVEFIGDLPISVSLGKFFGYQGHFTASPDERWLLHIQKVGSGQNIALLYQLDGAGRLLEIKDFDAAAWRFADTVSPLKYADLYHTGIEDPAWDPEQKLLRFTLRGKNAHKSGEGVHLKVGYHLETNRFQAE